MKKIFGVKFNLEKNGYIKGFAMKRDVTPQEAVYIADKLLGFCIKELYFSECEDREELKETKTALTKDINELLRGDCDEVYFMQNWSPGCEEDGFGLFNIFAVANYLKKKNII